MSVSIYPAKIGDKVVSHFTDDWDDPELNMNLANGNFYYVADALELGEESVGHIETDDLFNRVLTKMAKDAPYRDRLLTLCYKSKSLGATHIAYA